ncbi:MAG: phenylalanine--tRNA ligase subunit beta [Myxococcota bacterium]|nr:phenylalanine--tRNA ligase subunit beta [Myxococcota bacterium]
MLISCNWLARHVDLDGVDLDELGNRFTLNVAELEGVHRLGQDAAQCVVGYVLEAAHIDGTHLHLCQVDTGDSDPRQIICGAPNIAAGQSVPVVLPGMQLGDLKIEERTVRGHLSQGMIASEAELGLSEDNDGIMVLADPAQPGTVLGDLFPIEDVLFEIDNKSLTHRPDCWGHRGIAREVAALIGRPLKPQSQRIEYTDETPIDIRIQAPEACYRYTAVTMDQVSVAPSPLWLKILLHRVGIRSINNAVDATNFVMLDLGNPLHAFDARQITGNCITVRHAKDGEQFTTLDETDRQLTQSDLLIADGERGVALAGIMGGLNSEIKDDTTAIVLESATFNASTVRMTSSRLGLRTDSSARFEKSLDPNLAEDASTAFCVLLKELCPELRITSAFMDRFPQPVEQPIIDLSYDLVHRRLGTTLPEDTIDNYLTRLGFQIEKHDHGLRVTVPTWRATKDIGIAADLVEEIGRSYGYDNIAPTPPAVTLAKPAENKQKEFERAIRSYLTQGAGLDEVLTYSFDNEPLLEKIKSVPEKRLFLANAISAEMPAMRTSLAPNLLGALVKNERRFDSVNLFEIGRIFQPADDAKDLPQQPTTLGILIANKSESSDLFQHAKGIVLGLGIAIDRGQPELTQGGVSERPWVHPIRQARLSADGIQIGYLAEIHPLTLNQLDLGHQAAVIEINIDAWRERRVQELSYSALPKFPSVYRDFAVVVEESVRADDVRQAIACVDAELIRNVSFQSIFRSPELGKGLKCLAWSMTVRHDGRTLTDSEVRDLEDRVWRSLADRVSGKQRT